MITQLLQVPEVQQALERMRFVFDRKDVIVHKSYELSGDFVADAAGSWNAAMNGGSVVLKNSSHYYVETKHTQVVFQTVPQMEPLLANPLLYPYLGQSKLDASSFDGTPLSQYMREYYFMPVIAVILYVVVVFGGKFLMRNREPFHLETPLFLWNLGLSLFSWMGVFRIVPHLLLTINDKGTYFTMCEGVYWFGAGEAGLWTWLFIISKFPELIDTVFIVLRKKPLIFLHWYHHITVLLYCWQSYTQQNSAGIYFVAMNFTVHAIMYGYYALKAVKMWPRFIPSWIITLLQLSQMIVGVYVCVVTYKYQHIDGLPCSISDVSAWSGAIMYFSYFLLFLQILVQLLTKGVPKKKKQKTQ